MKILVSVLFMFGIAGIVNAYVVSDDFNSYADGTALGNTPNWYSGSGSNVVTGGIVGGASPIATMSKGPMLDANRVKWTELAVGDSLSISMDFQTSSDSHKFDDDRLGMHNDYDSTTSNRTLGAQLEQFHIETYFNNTGDTGERIILSSSDFTNLPASTWYTFNVTLTKLGDFRVLIETSLRAVSDNSLIASGSLDTDTLTEARRPHHRYFTDDQAADPLDGGLWPMFKNYNATSGNADNFSFEIIPADTSKATNPYPKNNATDILVDVGKLSWTPGEGATSHTVFLGTDVNSVTYATISDTLGTVLYQNIDVNSIDLARLEYGTTYYWRVDEIPGNGAGKIWSFTTEPEGVKLAATNVVGVEFNSPSEVYSYQDPNSTYNGKGLDDVNGTHSNENTETNSTMWVGMGDAPGDVWLKYELDQVYKLYQLQIWNYNEPEPSLPFGAKDVNILYSIDNVTWKALDEIQVFPMGTGESTYKADIFVNMNGAIAKYVKLSFLSSHTEGMYTGGISEIRFFVIPTRVTVPSPANNATNVDVGSILSWKAGRGVAVHKIYIDSDKNAVIDGTAAIKGETEDSSYSMVLGLGKTYYWKVDEVNDAEEYTTWDGPVWKFSTPQFILVDGFEIGYGNDPGKDAVFLTWKDGAELGDSSNGSYMGRKSEPYLQTINHSGGHSTQMTYDNQSYSYSEVKAQSEKLPIGTTDWSIGSPKTLTIWFRGDPNTTEISDSELYCKIGGKTATYSGSLDILMKDLWWQWDIDLAALGANLTNIPDITIGIKRVGTVGSQGVIYLDDIMLTGIQAVTSSPDLYIEAENYVTITAPMDVNNVLSGAFGGTYVGVTNGKSSSTTEPKYPEGTVTYNVTVDSGVYKIMARIYIQGNEYEGDSCWVKIPTATAVKTADGNDVTLTPAGSTIADGWVNSNNLVGGTSWQWDTFLSSLNSDQDALFTLTAGTHTILISNREDGLWIDALLLVKVGD